MADEVYKILQSRLRKHATDDGGAAAAMADKLDCEGCRQANCQQLDDPYGSHSNRRKRPPSTSVPGGGEDPLSHKIIEKRRRDRMNSCLADLSHLIPSNYLKKSRGRIEKTEIVEMAIKHIKHLHELLPSSSAKTEETSSHDTTTTTTNNAGGGGSSSSDVIKAGSNWQCPQEVDSFRNGYNECLAEAVHFLVEKERIPPENPICSRLVGHLNKNLELKAGGQTGQAGSGSSTTTQQSSSVPTPNAESSWSTGDSDYFSLKSECSTANSEVSSVTSNPALQAALNPQKIFPPRLIPATTTSLSDPGASGSSSVKRKSGSDEVISGKFKFKDSIRERFSHEFESHTDNDFHSSSSASGASSNNNKEPTENDYYAKRRRILSSKSCENHHPEDPKSSSQHHHHHHHHQQQQQQASDGKQQSEPESGGNDKKKSVPIFALHPKGSHYIPLSVSEDVIYPYLHLFDQGSDLPLMLHPISISVNFCGPIRIASGIRGPQKTSQSELTLATTKEDREF